MKRVSFFGVVLGMVMMLTLGLTTAGLASESNDHEDQSYEQSERQGGTQTILLPGMDRSNDHDTHDESGEERQGDSA